MTTLVTVKPRVDGYPYTSEIYGRQNVKHIWYCKAHNEHSNYVSSREDFIVNLRRVANFEASIVQIVKGFY